MSDAKTKMVFRVNNESDETVTFALEPWGDTYPMQPHQTFEVTAEGPENDRGVEIDFRGDAIVVYGWSGSVLSLFNNGMELGSGTSKREPAP